jgi:hypothetical protein
MKKAASAWVAALTWSQPAFSRIAAIPQALEKAQISPRSLRIFKSFGFPIYPINNALGVASNEVLFGRSWFSIFSCNPRISRSTFPWIHEAPQHFSLA